MAIQEGNIKLLASQVMDDVDEGGGRATGTVIADGTSNAIFADISELDRAYGRVNLRKVSVSVDTPDTDGYFGANVILAEPPSDARVSVTLFSTKDGFDRRTDAQSRLESYLVPGPEWPGYLLENHVAGQRVIQLFQRPSDPSPNIGETIVLVSKEGAGDQVLQYVRVISVSLIVRQYTSGNGQTYSAAVVSCEISDPLRTDFPGSPPSELFARAPLGTKTRETSVADAAMYAGVVPLTAVATIGDLQLSAASIFTQLVPSAQTEIPIVDANVAGQSNALSVSANGTVSYTTVAPFTSASGLSVGNAVTPGTLVITTGSGDLTDAGGQLFAGSQAIGSVDYGRGIVTFQGITAPYTGSKTVTFKPATAPLRVSDTGQIPVTIESRAYNYVISLLPMPTPGSVMVSYRAQGKWYDLRDTGSGALKGVDVAFGVGSVNYSTGTVLVTLGALPDVGSGILLAWATQANYINRSDMPVSSAGVRFTLPLVLTEPDPEELEPGSVVITWNDGTARTATDNSQGALTGDGDGTINYKTGVAEMTPATLPAGGQGYVVQYAKAAAAVKHTSTTTDPARNPDTTITIDLETTNIKPGTLRLQMVPQITNYGGINEAGSESTEISLAGIPLIADNGNGRIIAALGRDAGVIDYATGILTFQPDGLVTTKILTYSRYVWDFYGGNNVFRTITSVSYAPGQATLPLLGSIVATFQSGNDVLPPETLEFAAPAVQFDLTTRYQESIVAGSVNFTLGGRRYFDKAGQLYNGLEVTTGAATLAGEINYVTGAITLSDWAPGAANTVSVTSLLTTTGVHAVPGATFRVPASPVRPGSLQVVGTKAEGGTINVTADIDGSISGDAVRGNVDYETGVVGLEFGSLVTAAGNEGELWYDAGKVVAGQIFKPILVLADTIKFNAVAYSYLPLDAELIGLDPVRLPADGRVPIFRKGGMSVVHHTDTTAPQTVTNTQTVDLGRTRLSRVRVLGADGLTITDGYSLDLDAGTITFTDTAAYSQPVTIENRIEDMALISDAQLNGSLSLVSRLTHDYPLGSYVSSALIVGDMRARVPVLFDQATWNGTWTDALVGNAATGTYNDVLAPITVTNAGAITERWTLQFTNTTSFNVMGEHVGVIATGTTGADCAPVNPASGAPYFTVPALGWGAGWGAGNVLRFNTIGALYPIWIARTIQQGPPTAPTDSFTVLVRGDIDRP